jgi:hypothetical protein
MHRWRKSAEIMPLSTLVSGDHLRTLPLWRVMQFGLKPLTADLGRAIPHHHPVYRFGVRSALWMNCCWNAETPDLAVAPNRWQVHHATVVFVNVELVEMMSVRSQNPTHRQNQSLTFL